MSGQGDALYAHRRLWQALPVKKLLPDELADNHAVGAAAGHASQALASWFSFGVDAQDSGYAYRDRELYLLSLYEYVEAYSEIGTEAADE